MVRDLKEKKLKKKTFISGCEEILGKLKNGWKVQNSSANVLTFIVQDLLDYAQIKEGKFRKNIMQFNVINAVEEIMLILQRKALDNGNRLYVTFENIQSDKEHHDIDLSFGLDQHNFLVNTD